MRQLKNRTIEEIEQELKGLSLNPTLWAGRRRSYLRKYLKQQEVFKHENDTMEDCTDKQQPNCEFGAGNGFATELC